MADNVWDERRKSLEEAFFKERDRHLLEQLRKQYAEADKIAALHAVSGISDEATLQKLVESGVDASIFTALMLVPLVEVAWSDGAVQENEKEAVLKAAEAHAIARGTPAFIWLERLLLERPDPAVFAAWRAYVGALAKELPPQAVEASRNQMLRWVTRVAEAAGGFLGFGNKISPMEQATIHELERAYGAPTA
jgi:hypothetical protein